MTGSSKSGARPTREERLAEALRANLHRRKAQARERKDQDTPPSNDDKDAGGEPSR